MTREEARKAAEVMLAYANGEEIEFTISGGNNWEKVDNPSFNWYWEYRIKSKPKFDPKTLQPFDRVLVRSRSGNTYCWFADFIAMPVADNDTRGWVQAVMRIKPKEPLKTMAIKMSRNG